jgi:hypothetical protein
VADRNFQCLLIRLKMKILSYSCIYWKSARSPVGEAGGTGRPDPRFSSRFRSLSLDGKREQGRRFQDETTETEILSPHDNLSADFLLC